MTSPTHLAAETITLAETIRAGLLGDTRGLGQTLATDLLDDLALLDWRAKQEWFAGEIRHLRTLIRELATVIRDKGLANAESFRHALEFSAVVAGAAGTEAADAGLLEAVPQVDPTGLIALLGIESAKSDGPLSPPPPQSRPNIDARMRQVRDSEPDALGWSQRMWAVRLGCAPSTVAATPCWRELTSTAAAAAIARAAESGSIDNSLSRRRGGRRQVRSHGD
jgi:hypothetical protein